MPGLLDLPREIRMIILHHVLANNSSERPVPRRGMTPLFGLLWRYRTPKSPHRKVPHRITFWSATDRKDGDWEHPRLASFNLNDWYEALSSSTLATQLDDNKFGLGLFEVCQAISSEAKAAFLELHHIVLESAGDLNGFLGDNERIYAKSVTVKTKALHPDITKTLSCLLTDCPNLTYLELMVSRNPFTWTGAQECVFGRYNEYYPIAEWLLTCKREPSSTSWEIAMESERKIEELDHSNHRNSYQAHVKVRNEKVEGRKRLGSVLSKLVVCTEDEFPKAIEEDFHNVVLPSSST